MIDSDKRAFMETLLAACAVYDRKPLHKTALQMYWEILKGESLEAFQSAMGRHMETSKFFPKPAELRELIHGSTELNASDAWLAARSRIGKYDDQGRYIGADNKPNFDDPRIQQCVDLYWRDMCLRPESEQQWVQKRFEETYATIDTVQTREAITNGNVVQLPDLSAGRG